VQALELELEQALMKQGRKRIVSIHRYFSLLSRNYILWPRRIYRTHSRTNTPASIGDQHTDTQLEHILRSNFLGLLSGNLASFFLGDLGCQRL